eukprot:7043407-Alexandrium_andersonii.AAC.1
MRASLDVYSQRSAMPYLFRCRGWASTSVLSALLGHRGCFSSSPPVLSAQRSAECPPSEGFRGG